MLRTVYLDPGAASDIRRITGFLSRRVSPESANRWQTQTTTTIARLETEADIWPEADEAAALNRPLKCRLHGRRPHVYRILYTIDGDIVNVVRIRHAAQNSLIADDF